MIKLVYFASIRERLACAEERLELPEQVREVADLVALLRARGEPWQSVLGDANLLVAVDQQMGSLGTALAGAEEVAFFPPVTGG